MSRNLEVVILNRFLLKFLPNGDNLGYKGTNVISPTLFRP